MKNTSISYAARITVSDDFAPLSQNGKGRQGRSVTPYSATSFSGAFCQGKKKKRGKKAPAQG
jgi:hypothetical protein